MAIESQSLTREFAYNGMKLPDPNVALSVTQVAELYSTSFPELLNASIEGPEIKDGKSIYTFHKAAGTKG